MDTVDTYLKKGEVRKHVKVKVSLHLSWLNVMEVMQSETMGSDCSM